MATRLLPARIVGPRVLAPRISGRQTGSTTQTATHLVLTTQPGGAVSGVPLAIQPAGQALDGTNVLDPTFGGTITAVVSSGTASITAGGSVSASAGGFAFTTLTLVGAGLVTITLQSSPLTPVTSIAFQLTAAGAVVLVESPTRLGTMRRFAKTGDTVVITDTLMGVNRDPQDLPSGSSAVLTLKTEDGTVLVNRQPVTILQTGAGDTATAKGGVTITLPPSTNLPAGTSSFEIEATTPTGDILTFPDDSNAELVVIPQLG